MIIEYDVSCFERTLVIKCPNNYAEHEKEIKMILDKAYYEWHSPEDIEDPIESKIVQDSCCEEHMMSRVGDVYPGLRGEWDTFYYGDDENEIAEDMERHLRDRDWNDYSLIGILDKLEDMTYKLEPFEKLGNEAYWIVKDCIEKLKELKLKSTKVYKCKHCGFSCWDADNEVEEELWGHIQMHHEDKFEEVQNWETPDMIEECYEEEM